MRKAVALAVLLGPVAALASDRPTVIQSSKRFSVETLSVARDTIIEFVNDDSFRHNVSVRTPSGETRSGIVQSPGEVTGISFDEEGLYRVTCLIHPQMLMTVIVK